MSSFFRSCCTVFLVACARGADPSSPTPEMAPHVESPKEKAPASVGTATMAADGTITLHLVTDDNGMHGEAMRLYPKTDKDYDGVLKHLGGLAPGESKSIPPWD